MKTWCRSYFYLGKSPCPLCFIENTWEAAGPHGGVSSSARLPEVSTWTSQATPSAFLSFFYYPVPKKPRQGRSRETWASSFPDQNSECSFPDSKEDWLVGLLLPTLHFKVTVAQSGVSEHNQLQHCSFLISGKWFEKILFFSLLEHSQFCS